MGYSSRRPQSLLAVVRRYFNLEQQELAAYLGVSRAQLANLETGRRALTAELLERLRPLRQHTPVPAPPLPAGAVPDAEIEAAAPPPAREPLEARRDYCTHTAAGLRRQQDALRAQATYAARWRQALPALLAALPPPGVAAPTPPPGTPPAPLLADLLREQFRARPTALSAAELAQWHLLRLRAEALETEAAALAALLAGAS